MLKISLIIFWLFFVHLLVFCIQIKLLPVPIRCQIPSPKKGSDTILQNFMLWTLKTTVRHLILAEGAWQLKCFQLCKYNWKGTDSVLMISGWSRLYIFSFLQLTIYHLQKCQLPFSVNQPELIILYKSHMIQMLW